MSQSSKPLSLAGQLLLAMPDMPDPRFRQSVIVICVHDEQGALGIALGEPVADLSLHDLLRSFDLAAGDIGGDVVLAGGPMEPRRGFVLHGTDWLTQDSLIVGADLALTGSLDVLRAIAQGDGPADYLVALGYAGWGGGQLEEELTRPGWFTLDRDPRRLFALLPQERWAAAYALGGIDPAMLAARSGHA